MNKIIERLRFRRWGKWILGGVVAFGLVGTISVEATSRSSFCNSCHIMEPYYTSWSHGSHKNVECVECHIEPGPTSFVQAKLNGLGQVVDDVLHRTSNKPSASVSQLSCLRSGCHTTETLEKRKINNGRFKFDHSKHFGQKHLGVEITCGTCHSHVKGDEHFEVNTSVCITCHLVGGATKVVGKGEGRQTSEIHFVARSNGGPHALGTPKVTNGDKVPPAACTGCHDAPEHEIEFQGQKFLHSQFLAFGATCESCHQGVTATPPVIDDGRCLECHTFGIEKSLESKEMHRVHTIGRHKIECFSCHGAVRHGPQVQTASVERFDCNRCHVDQHGAQRSMYFNAATHPSPGAAAPTDLVSPMFLAHVDCTGCHIKARPVSSKPEATARVMVAEPSACDQCHQTGLGERMIPLWQKSTRAMYDQVEAELRAAEAGGSSPAVLARVRTMLDLIRTDGSWGVHNPRYTQSILEQARAILAGKEGAG